MAKFTTIPDSPIVTDADEIPEEGPELVDENGLPVLLISGAQFTVLSRMEVRYMNDRVHSYMEAFKWQNTSDLQDVDRMLILELLVYRYGLWLSRRYDYFNDPVDENALRRTVNDLSGELRQLKKQLGMDKASRDKESGDDSVPAYLERLRQRAKEFGITRNKEAEMVRTLGHQLIALYQLMLNCDEQERLEQRCRPEDLISWIGEDFIPKFTAIDATLRKSQRYWIQDQ